jgi:hypothetical protein
VEDLLIYLLAFLGVLLMFMGVINMLIIEIKSKKTEQKKSKSKYVKLLIGWLNCFYCISDFTRTNSLKVKSFISYPTNVPLKTGWC